MNIKYFFIALIFNAILLQTHAQECKMYFPVEEGTEIETRSYDKKDKLTGISRQKIVSKEISDEDITINIAHKSFDKKGELLMDGNFQVHCVDGVFIMDMRNMLDDAALSAYENMEIEVNANDLAYPVNMEVGKTLPDADISVKVNSGGMTVFTMTVFVSNRKIEARESITTPAGTFDCFKISYDIESKMVIKVKAKAVEWITEDLGVIRSDTYNKSGKLQGYSLLHQITNP